MNLIKRILLRRNPMAFVCLICPLCIIARAKPQSGWAKFVKMLSGVCPFCRAYKKIKAKNQNV